MKLEEFEHRGMCVRSEVVWLVEHADYVTEGTAKTASRTLCCKTTGERIALRAVHRTRPRGSTGPFTDSCDWSGPGEQISFTTFWCDACGMTLPRHEQITLGDLVSIEGETLPPNP